MMTLGIDEREIIAAARSRGWQLTPDMLAGIRRELTRLLDHAAIVETFLATQPDDGAATDEPQR